MSSTAVITGASSGIGAAFAKAFASLGHSLLLQGRREPELASLCASLARDHGVRAEYVLAELSHADELAALERRLQDLPDLEVLVNNAGFGSQSRFQSEDIGVTEQMIRVHILASVRLAHAAIPAMKRRNHGTIINVSSVAAFMVAPRNNTYCATKLYLNSFSESLALELRNDGIKVQALCPGFTKTDFHRRLGVQPKGYGMKFMTPEEVVQASLSALRTGQVVCIPKLKYKFAVLAARLLPRPWMYALARRLG